MSLKQIQTITFKNYKGSHYERKTNKRGRGVLTYIMNDSTYKIRKNLCICDIDREIVTIELITNTMRNITVLCCYKQPSGNWKNHCNHLQGILTNATVESKLYFVTEDFKLSCLECHQSSEIRQFFNDKFEKGAIPLINRGSRVTTSNATLIDNIFTNCVFDTSLKKGILLFQTTLQYLQQ